MLDEDERWLEGLAGHDVGRTAAGPALQGAALRAAVLARRVADAGTVPAADPQREAVLIGRAREAGLLPPHTQGDHSRMSRAPRRTLWWASLAAAVTFVVVGISLQRHTPAPVATLRGGSTGVVRIRAGDPLQLKRELLREFNAVGVHAVGYENLGRQGIDADLPMPLPDTVRGILVRHAIPVPAGNALQLEIETQDGP